MGISFVLAGRRQVCPRVPADAYTSTPGGRATPKP